MAGGHLDTANACTIDDSELNVALVTPGDVPGVLDEPVVLAALGTVTDSEDGMIERRTAGGGVEDTGLVSLEDSVVSLEEDRDGLDGEGGLELGDVVGSDVAVLLDLNAGLGLGAVRARAGCSSGARDVRVDRLELSIVRLQVLESPDGVATVAAHVAVGGAIDKLLLGEGEELTSGNLVGTLEGAGSGESPAGAARALVFDGGDGTCVNPVDGVGDVGLVEDHGGGHDVVLVFMLLEAEHALVLLMGPVRELVVASDPGVLVLVDHRDVEVVGLENLETGIELINGVEVFAELSEVVHVLDLEGVDSGGDTERGSDGERFHFLVLFLYLIMKQ